MLRAMDKAIVYVIGNVLERRSTADSLAYNTMVYNNNEEKSEVELSTHCKATL